MSADNCTVFIGALDPSVSDSQLRDAFSPFGSVVLVKIARNCAFVEFANPASVMAAVSAMNGTTLGNGRIRVLVATPKDRRPPPRREQGWGGMEGGGGGGGYQQQYARPAYDSYAAAAPSYPPPSAASSYPLAPVPLPIAPSDPYTEDQDDVACESYAPGMSRPFDAHKKNDAFVAAQLECSAAKCGALLQFME